MNVSLVLALICVLVRSSSGFNPNKLLPPVIESKEEEAFAKWITIEKGLKNAVGDLIRQMMPKLLKSSGEVEVNIDCMTDLMKIVFDLRQLKLWAIRVLDATGKPGGSQLSGTISAMGDYDACLDIVFPQDKLSKRLGETPTKGQYCFLELTIPLPPRPDVIRFSKSPFINSSSTFETELMEHLKTVAFGLYTYGFRLGVCVPSTCDQTDIQKMATAGGKELNSNIRVYSCETKQPFTMDTTQIVIGGILLVLVGIVVVSSIADYFLGDTKSIGRDLVSAFSFNRNFRKTFAVKQLEDTRLECLNGIKAISMAWVVLGHTYSSFDPVLVAKGNTINLMRKEALSMVILNGFLVLQAFYVISGVLLSYNLVQAFDSKRIKKLNVPLIIFRRAWRLLPAMLLVIAFAILFPILGSGPLYKDTSNFYADNCRNNWWYNVLFISNFLDFKQICYEHTWYVSSDMQLFVVAMIYFYMLFKKPICGKLFLVFLIVVSSVTAACVTYFFNLPPQILFSVLDFDYIAKFIRYILMRTYAQLGTFAIALALGTFMARTEKIKLSKIVVLFGWCISTIVAMSIIFGVLPWNSGRIPTQVESTIYGSLHRTVWGLCIGWVVLACGYGYAGFINSFLSWSGFQPLVRVSYLVYITHFPIVNYYVASLREPIYFCHITGVWLFMATLSLSVVASVVLRVLFEAPTVEMDKIFMKAISGGYRQEKQQGNINSDALTLDRLRHNKSQAGIENGGHVPEETEAKSTKKDY